MRNYFKKVIYLVVLTGFNLSHAGSYEDFFIAIKRDDPAAITALLQRGFDPDTRDPDGLPGLYLAVREPSLKAAEALIAWPKSNVEVRTAQDESPPSRSWTGTPATAHPSVHHAVPRQTTSRPRDTRVRESRVNTPPATSTAPHPRQ